MGNCCDIFTVDAEYGNSHRIFCQLVGDMFRCPQSDYTSRLKTDNGAQGKPSLRRGLFKLSFLEHKLSKLSVDF